VSSLALPAFLASAEALSPSRSIFLLTAPVPTVPFCFCGPICPTGHQLLALSLMFCRLNNLSGTVPVFWQTIAQAKSSLSTPSQLLDASFPHSGDWLHVITISSCGLRLDNEAVRVGVGLRLGLSLYVPHRHTNVTVVLRLMHRNCMALSARKLQEDRTGTVP